MKQFYRLLSLLLCLAVLLTLVACKSEPEAESSEDPVEPAPTETEAPPATATAAELYAEAVEALLAQDALTLSYEISDIRTVFGEEFSQHVAAEVNLAGLQADLLAEKNGEVSFNGEAPIVYEEQFADNKLYSVFSDVCSMQEITAEDYLASRYPVSLVDADHYGSITVEETSDGTLYHFTEPNALESWLVSEHAELIDAQATVFASDEGISEVNYAAQYRSGAANISFTITAKISAGAEYAFEPLPADGSEYLQLSNVLIPWAFEWATSNIFHSSNLTASIQQLIQSEAAGVMTFDTTLNTSYDRSLLANITHSVAFVMGDTTTAYTAEEHLESGVYTYTVDGVVQAKEDMQDAQFQNGIDYMLDQYIVLNYWITDATVTESEGVWLIDFASSDEECADYIKYCVSNELYGSSTTLDDIASAYVTNDVSGTLAVDMDTMLPSAYSLSYSGTHTIEDVDYVLSQTYNMSITPASPSAYYSITGEHSEETAPETAATPLFYHVTGNDGSEMWLLGTIHLGDEHTAYLPQEIYNAFDASDALAVEVNLNAISNESYTQDLILSSFYTDGQPISAHIEPAVYDAALMALRAGGAYSAQMEIMKAALWENQISNAYISRSRVLDGNKGVDLRLLDRAEAAGKEILEIESFEQQYRMMTGYSDALQEYLLSETLAEGYYQYIASITELYALWCEGDEAALTKYLTEEDTSDLAAEELALYNEYNKVMLTDRNAGMLQTALEYLQSDKTVFYAVGLAHLLGDTGLAEGLRAAGYTVELVPYSNN